MHSRILGRNGYGGLLFLCQRKNTDPGSSDIVSADNENLTRVLKYETDPARRPWMRFTFRQGIVIEGVILPNGRNHPALTPLATRH